MSQISHAALVQDDCIACTDIQIFIIVLHLNIAILAHDAFFLFIVVVISRQSCRRRSSDGLLFIDIVLFIRKSCTDVVAELVCEAARQSQPIVSHVLCEHCASLP